MTSSVGILAYGSLITDPGDEIKPKILRRICCRTPFKVEYARSSGKRDGAPTLVPYNEGEHVNAHILVVDLPLSEAKDRLYRRETGKTDVNYTPPMKITCNSVLIKSLRDYAKINHVIYTCIGANIRELTGERLACLAIRSARTRDDGQDGISYLMDAIDAGISTPLSDAYKAAIMKQTRASTLEDALRTCRSADSADKLQTGKSAQG